MKILTRNALFVLLGLTVVSTIMPAQLLTTASASEQPPVLSKFEITPRPAMKEYAMNNDNPVDAVIGAAEFLGFNPKADTFSLVSQTSSQAIVQVQHNGINYNVTLELSPNSIWTISTMTTSIVWGS